MQHGRTRQSLLLQCISLVKASIVKDYNPTQQSAVLSTVQCITIISFRHSRFTVFTLSLENLRKLQNFNYTSIVGAYS